MGQYAEIFKTHDEYESSSGKAVWNYCIKDAEIHYNPPAPTYEYVDLGLPSGTLWAKWNVGATSETEYGNYYRYGRGAATYKETSGDSRYSGTENPLAASADTAAQVWGGSWHMPTKAQFSELMRNTNYEWTTIDGVNGGKFTATNGNYVFFPATGNFNNDYYYDEGITGYYWTSTYNNEEGVYFFFCAADDWDVFPNGDSVYESVGSSVRPVVG